MGKTEKPQRVPAEDRNPQSLIGFIPTGVKAPEFTIKRITGEKRKRMVIGNASDHVLDY